MIFDTLDNLSNYRSLSENFARAFDVLTSTDFSELLAGKYVVDGDELFYMIQEPTLKHVEDARYEVHNRYADIQLAFTDGEVILALPKKQIKEWKPFNEKGDAGLSQNSEPGISLEMKPGCFAIFFPQDAHMPCVRGGKAEKCRKLVFKVKL